MMKIEGDHMGYRGMPANIVMNADCPICNKPAYSLKDEGIDASLILCWSCGKFRLSFEALTHLKSLPVESSSGLYKLSFFTRSVSERALGTRDNSYFPIYSADDLGRQVEVPDPQVQEKLDLLLNHLSRASKFPGDRFTFDYRTDYPVLCAHNVTEAEFYLNTLAEGGSISLDGTGLGSPPRGVVTGRGWMLLEQLVQSGADSPNGFIAMWFDPSQVEIEAAITAAITSAGYRPIRIDKVEHLNRIDDEIIARIRQSKFLVADFTKQRNGVYFEAGFMLGLGRPVIWMCAKSDLADLHFDTRQYNMIDYADADDLKRRLQVRIEANLGKGPVPTRPSNSSS